MKFTKEGQEISLPEFERFTGAKWIPGLEFDDPKVFSSICKTGAKLYKKGEMTLEQVWLGRYFQQEIAAPPAPDVEIRWIDNTLGWGVFALRDLKKMTFLAEYGGKVRKRIKNDTKNGYCFEYVLVQGFSSPYVIDAQEQGSVARYINHSSTPNLNSALATIDHVSHVVLYAKEPIAKGTQLCYDYGSDYWSQRTAPIPL